LQDPRRRVGADANVVRNDQKQTLGLIEHEVSAPKSLAALNKSVR
jgi:hypothetical protein